MSFGIDKPKEDKSEEEERKRIEEETKERLRQANFSANTRTDADINASTSIFKPTLGG